MVALPTPPSGHPSLARRAVNAGSWTLLGYGLSQAIRFGSNLIMTRLLAPELFGVMAIATIVMIAVAMFSDLGLSQNIIRSRRGDDPAFLNTAWSLGILRGLALWVVSLAIALCLHLADQAGIVPADSVYADPSLPWIIGVLSFGAVIGGFTTTKIAEASRNLRLGQLTRIQLAAQIAGLCVMLAWVGLDRSVWALVAGSLSATIVSVAAAHAFLPGTRNRWQWDGSAVTELVHFGKWIFMSSILGFLVANSDRLMLGAMIDGSTFGVAVIAFFLVASIDQMVSRLMGSVGLPALSEVVGKGGDLRAAYYRLHLVIAATAYVSAGFLVIAGDAVVAVLYDQRYADAGWMLQILAVGLLAAPAQIATQSYLALGRPHLLSVVLTVRLAGLFALLPIGFVAFGLPGALGGIALSQLLSLPVVIAVNRRAGILDVGRELRLVPLVLVGAVFGTLFDLAAR